MLDMTNALLPDIKLFLEETGMGPSYFGKAACGNSEVVDRLESGGRVWPETETKIRAFMLVQRRSRPAPLPKTRGSNTGVAA